MGLRGARSLDEYRDAIRGLYPAGEWWDKQFADSLSDFSLYVKALSREAHRVQGRAAALLDEACPDRATELIAEYEAMFGLSSGEGLDTRRARITGALNAVIFQKADWERIADQFGFTANLQRQKGFVCGLSRCGDRLWGVAARCYLVFVISHPPGVSAARRGEFEQAMRDQSPLMYALEFKYKELSA